MDRERTSSGLSGRQLEGTTVPDFQCIVGRARQGDQAAWAALLRGYEPRLGRAADALLGPEIRSEVDSADLVQVVHWNLWLGLRAGKYVVTRPEDLLALALTILRRKVSRVWRRLQRQRCLAAQTNRIQDWKPGAVLAGPDRSDPADRVLADDQFEFLCKSLNATERSLIELRLQGYSTAEAARELGHPPATLRVVHKRLRDKLGSLVARPARSGMRRRGACVSSGS